MPSSFFFDADPVIQRQKKKKENDDIVSLLYSFEIFPLIHVL